MKIHIIVVEYKEPKNVVNHADDCGLKRPHIINCKQVYFSLCRVYICMCVCRYARTRAVVFVCMHVCLDCVVICSG